MGKFSNDDELALDYRPYLHEICRVEESKQQAFGRKRFLHYLSQTTSLLRDDFGLLAKSNLAEIKNTSELTKSEGEAVNGLTETKVSGEKVVTLFDDSQLYSNNN